MSIKREQKNRLKSRPSQKPRQRQAPTVNHVRRKLLVRLGLGSVAVAGGIFGIRELLKDELSEEKLTTETPTSKQTNQENKDHELESQMLQMPTVKFTDEKVKYPMPDDLNLAYDEYIQAASEVAHDVEHQLIPILKSSFARLPNVTQQQREETFLRFTSAVLTIFIKNPKFRQFIKANSHIKSSFAWNKYIKPLLAAGGIHYNLEYTAEKFDDNTGKPIPTTKLELHRINGGEIIEMSDKHGVTKVTVLMLGDTLFALDAREIDGEYDSELEMGLIFQNEVDAKKKIDRLVNMGIISARPKDEERIAKEFIRDDKIHEATHVLIGKHYELGKATDLSAFYQVPVKVQIGNDGRVVDVSGIYAPIHFHEACATGSQIFHNDSDFPLDYATKLASYDSYGYRMVHKILPLLTIKFISDPAERNKIINDFYSSDLTLKPVKLIQIALTKISKEDRKKIGAMLYHIGEDCFKNAAAGVYRKVGGGL